MIGRIVRWFRSTGPPWWLVVLFLLVYLVIEALVWFVWGIAQTLGEPDLVTDYYKVRTVVATVGAVLYAAYRLLAFHPVTRPAYRQWLEQTPWTPAKLLPMGSPRPGLGDFLLLAVLCWLAGRDYPVGYVGPVFGFVAAYCVATCAIAGLCRQRVTLYLLAFGLVLVIRLAGYLPAALFALVALYPIAWIGVGRSLDPARWPEPGQLSRLNELPGNAKESTRQLGWPHGPLGPHPRRRIIVRPEKALVPLLVGWLAYAVLSNISYAPGRESAAGVVIGGATVFLCLLRTVAYVSGHFPPISLMGRLVTGRWIIPGYDKIFVGPLATVAAYVVLEATLAFWDTPVVIGQPLVAAACLAIWMNVGPSLSDWQLTGRHRISSFGFQANRTQFRQV